LLNGGILGFVILASIANILGGLVIFLKRDWSRRGLNSLMALSAGLLLSIAILDLVPEAIEIHSFSPKFMLLGIMAIFFFQQFVASHFHFGEEIHKERKSKTAVLGSFLGLLIHTFFDGLAIVVSFQVDLRLGITVFIAVLLHKIPDGLTISSIVFVIFQDKKKAVWAATLLGISTILGAVTALALAGVALPYEQITAMAISFTAGIFIYVAGTDLLPAVNAVEDRLVALFFFLGILLYFVLQWGFQTLAPFME